MGPSWKEVPPYYMRRWQHFADVMASSARVPAAMVMRVWPEELEVLIASIGPDNPYRSGDRDDLGTGLYCETVMAGRSPLMVQDALASPLWRSAPEVELNMISYFGLPLIWPDDTIFGTVCVLDSVAHAYSEQTQALLADLKDAIEDDFRTICGAEASESSAERFLQAALGRDS